MNLIERTSGTKIDKVSSERIPRRDRFQWTRLQRWEDLKAFSETWRSLSPTDRAFYATIGTTAQNPNGTGNATGDAARIIGAQDIEEYLLGICGCDEPIRCERSAIASQRRDEIEKQLLERLTKMGITPYKGSLSYMFYALAEIATQHLPEEPSPNNPQWKTHYRLSEKTFWTWLVEDATLPEKPPFK